ncbi:MAG: DUF2909 domain-containing protein [Cellvibrionaceae bacterium]|nr:DUF2909 domain-containing protein [Cellvibrionaceae bacterium]
MLLKILILILFIAVIISLTSGLIFLLKDMNVPESKRTLYALGIRLTLAVTLMATIAYGIQTGQLKNKAPWDNLPRAQSNVR